MSEQVPEWVIDRHGGTPDDWRRVGGGWAHKTAAVGDGAKIKHGATIGAGATVGARATIGEWSMIGDGAQIGERATIGEWSTIGKRAMIGHHRYICLVGVGSHDGTLMAYPRDGHIEVTRGYFVGTLDEFAARSELHNDIACRESYAAIVAAIRTWAKVLGLEGA